MRTNRREFIRLASLTAAGTIASACTVATPQTIPAIEAPGGAPAAAPTTPAEAAPSAHMEAPALAEKVASGELPQVSERLPLVPCVYPMAEAVGQYGGALREGFPGGLSSAPGTPSRQCLLHHDPMSNLWPDVAESWETNEDATLWTVHLRPGLRWSDGHPFDATALTWCYEHEVMNTELSPQPPSLLSVGSPATVMDLKAVDDYTVTIGFVLPYPLFMHTLAREEFFAPGHYLKNFHPDTCDDEAALEKAVSEGGYTDWTGYYSEQANAFLNTDLPTLRPWIAANRVTDPIYVCERNPYFHAVDPQGKQLPYCDRTVLRTYENPDVYNMWVINGEIDLDLAVSRQSIGNYTLYRENETKGDYHVDLWLSDKGETLTINHDCRDPRIAAFFQDRDVRIALNVAMDRDSINEMCFDGLCKPRQASPIELGPYYHEGAEKAYAYYDPDMANEHLDKAGYDQRDAQGYRVWKDGSGERVGFIIEGFTKDGEPETDAVMMVIQYLADVGVQATWKSVDRSLYYEHIGANMTEAEWWTVGHFSEVMLVHHNYYVGQLVDRPWAGGWGLWVLDHDDPNGEPPPDGHFLWRMWELWDQAVIEADEDRRLDLNRQIFDIWAEEVPVVGVLGEKPLVECVKNGLRNFTAGNLSTHATGYGAILPPATYFWDEPDKHA